MRVQHCQIPAEPERLRHTPANLLLKQYSKLRQQMGNITDAVLASTIKKTH